jgi:adenylate cyclase
MNTLPKRRLKAIFAADVVGYSKLMAEDEAGTLSLLKKHRHTVFDPEISKHGGRIFKLMGDGTLVEFPSVVDAVAAALSIQESLAKQGGAIQLRIGINLGDVIFDGDDIYGDGVNIAARLEELAEPGGLCVSSVVHESLGNRIDAKFVDAGEYEVKNIPHLIRIYRYKPEINASASHSDKTTKSSERPSIAVLPFDNMSSDPEQDYLADGITEDLITALSKVRWFFVIARNSTFTYKGQVVDVTQVARDLGVRYVLEGSTRRAGDRVRITAQLIEAGTGRHVWAERYDRQIEDIFDLQDEMTQTIVGAVEPELSAAERKRALNKAPENLDAWECYQRGLWHLWKYQKDNHRQGLELLQRATELDPGFASAYAWEAYAHYNAVIMAWSPNAQQSLENGMRVASKALTLDDKDPLGYFSAGRIYMMQGQHDESIASLKTAIELNPSFALAFYALGMVLTLSGDLKEAKTALYKSERLSPRDPIRWALTSIHSLACILSADYEGAIDWANKTVQNPLSSGYLPYAMLAASLVYKGQMEEARKALATALETKPDLSISYLENTLPTRESGGLDPYLDALRKAGLPE